MHHDCADANSDKLTTAADDGAGALVTSVHLCDELQHVLRRRTLHLKHCGQYAFCCRQPINRYRLLFYHYANYQNLYHLIAMIFFKYTSHHGLSVLQPSNFSMHHICLLILVGVLSATALVQHEIPFLPPLKTVRL